jgi:death-on-curing protein
VESVATNHGFVDGNKRTALILLAVILVKSGYVLAPLPGENLDDAVEQMILDVVEHRLTKRQAIEWLKQRVRKIP